MVGVGLHEGDCLVEFVDAGDEMRQIWFLEGSVEGGYCGVTQFDHAISVGVEVPA